ncbi:Phosphate-selective porin O and P [Chitinophaga eiseniae]|uniref:Phosphate-selective porin O and P n=1 Tax=Chitinophaga eiseniae TaxID=634771 RepID=A0A1T4RN66_9BACT|nr:porin [Chitinophaga eiseniae]SKA17188.1 Phosphate-selective porin O and P [Chitinophaga eiseniae]
MHKRNIRLAAFFLCLCTAIPLAYAGAGPVIDTTVTRDTTAIKPGFLKKITLGGVFQARYTVSLHSNVDVNGTHQADAGKEVVRNSFSLKRARLQVKAQVSDRFQAGVLVNFADFASDPKGKVLENAFISYRWNDAVNFTVGQFRPSFGLEDLYPVDIIRSMDFSNQYYAFGNNGWQSFQVGVSMFGTFRKNTSLPIKYAVSVVNGNNRNQVADDDNGKLASARLEFGDMNKLSLGLNGGAGTVKQYSVYALGIDFSGVVPLAEKFDLQLQSEFKQGTNHRLFYGLADSLRRGPLNEYGMHGVYLLPNFRYKINYHKLTSIEVSMRYEYFNEDYRHSGNARRTYIPMISLAFLKDYGGRIQLGMQIDNYDRNIPGTKTHNSNLMIVQVQCRI